MAHPFACICIVPPGSPAWPGPLRGPYLPTQLLAGFVTTDHRLTRIIGQLIRLQAIFPPPDNIGIGLGWDAPRCNHPRTTVIFFTACRTVSVLREATKPHTTSASASSCKVQWSRPSGGARHAKRTQCCAMSPLILILSGQVGASGSGRQQGPLSQTVCESVPRSAGWCPRPARSGRLHAPARPQYRPVKEGAHGAACGPPLGQLLPVFPGHFVRLLSTFPDTLPWEEAFPWVASHRYDPMQENPALPVNRRLTRH